MVEPYSEIDLAEFIDHSLLTPVATAEQVRQWCLEAEQFNFPTVCFSPVYIKQAAEWLHRKQPQVCTVIGYPAGATTSSTKLYEAQEAVEAGATELDVMLNLAWLKSGQTDELYRELAQIRETVGVPLKAVLETYLLTDSEKQLAVAVSIDAGASFIQTNTGWGGPATVADVRLLKSAAKDQIQIKAAAGIQTFEQAIELILAGATRLGTSRGPDLVRQRDTLEKEAI